LPEVLAKLSAAGAVVLIAAPGAGKTTRVPPAVLDAGMAELEDKGSRPGQIVVLQPRRVAARAAASRIAEERGTRVGEEIGYQVRHERRLSARTRILVCTEGVFLRRLQEDPLLENVAAVIFDEFHERSLDSDLALALVRQVRSELRPDLKLVVMSATLDAEPVSSYLNNCPVVESPGRTYPVNIEYFSSQPKGSLEQSVATGVKQMLGAGSGHVLAFLPGVGEIRRTQELLEPIALEEKLLLLPLYGDLPLDEQQQVLKECGQRKVVLATNVAETSLTIDGITAVVDSGMARVNRLDPRLGLNRLGLERISKASAEQRAGRAGRTAGGSCLRLWTEREHQGLSAFNSPEIERVDLSECALQLLAWGEKDLRAFAWFEAPLSGSLSRALELLEGLDATQGGSLTDLGRSMALLPLHPRLARLLIDGARAGEAYRAALCAALLSERDPIKRVSSLERGVRHKSESDVLDRLWAIDEYEKHGHRHSLIGELVVGQVKQISRAADQLLRLLKELNLVCDEKGVSPSAYKVGAAEHPKDDENDEALMKALMGAFLDRVCRRREPGSKRALMVGGRGVRLADECAVSDAELFVAVELLETGQSEASVRQASTIEKSWLPSSHLSGGIDVIYDSTREKVVAYKRTRFCDLIIEEGIAALPPEVDVGEILARALLACGNLDLASFVDDDSKQFLARINCINDNIPELGLPQFSGEPWRDLLSQWCLGLTSLAELKSRSFLPVLQAQLTYRQLCEVDNEAPERLLVPSGNLIKLTYEVGKTPVLAVRIQELFGMNETPRIAGGRQPVLLHLLAPNYRVQQITPDLASFWKNTYGEVKKDLKARYPKHSWPDNPLLAPAERGPKRRS
jgi:ATP-dependent helicase HrpB